MPNERSKERARGSKGLKFGFSLPQGTSHDLPEKLSADKQYELMRNVAREGARLGFDSVWLVDHLHTIGKSTKSNFEGWTTIVALFAEVDQIRMGHLVTCNLFRHPSILAKMSSVVDVISKGRLEFGIGAGWYEEEATAYGLPFPSPGERVGMLEEAVQIIRAMWTKRSVSFDGAYYKLRNAVNEPKPLQRPHPPIWIGGNKEKMLRVVARYADKWNPNCPIEELPQKMAQLHRACLEVKRDFESIEKTFAMDIFIGEGEREVEKIKKRVTSLGSPFDFRTGVAGTVEDVVERVQTLRTLGVTYFSFNIPNVSEFEPLRTLAKEVIPRVE